ncbi:MAG: hypothetical protein D6705_03495 [Deltaproteobacteria bacterium]|nr:MAG: hypothetical protein D6705_03495 [Deltaproteobacteria bacterium]
MSLANVSTLTGPINAPFALRAGRHVVGRGFRIVPPGPDLFEALAEVEGRRLDPVAAARDLRLRATCLRRNVLRAAVGHLCTVVVGAEPVYVDDVRWTRNPVVGEKVAPVATVAFASERCGVVHLTLRVELLDRRGKRLVTFRVGANLRRRRIDRARAALDAAA